MILKLDGMLSIGPQEVLGIGGIYGTFFSTPSLVIVVPCETNSEFTLRHFLYWT